MENKENLNMKTLNTISFVAMTLSTITAGIFNNRELDIIAMICVGTFALSGIICCISDLVEVKV